MGDGLLEHGGGDTRVEARERERGPYRYARIRSRARGEAIAEPDGHDRRGRHETGEPRCTGPEPQRCVARRLATLREPPQHASRPIEQRRRVTQRERTVARAVDLDTDAAGEREEAQLGEPARIHQRIRIAPRHPLRHDERDEPVPPRRVVRDTQHRSGFGRAHEMLDAFDAQRAERRAHAGLRSTGEPARERPPLARGDHRASHAATSAAASGNGGRTSASRSSGTSALRARHDSTTLRHHVVVARRVIESQPRARMLRPMSA